MSSRIHLSSPDVGPAEEEALLRAFRSGWVAPLGPEVDAFEAEVARLTDRAYALALCSGTAALHLGLLGLGVGPEDVVLTATMTFVATANAIVYTGARPVFVDSGPDGNIDPDLLAHAVADQRRQGRSVAAIVPVDLFGRIADYEAILPVAADATVPVLADAAESLGARRGARPAGAFGEAAVLSFNGNKIITTSGGGMLVTDDRRLAERARYLATQAREPMVHYEHTAIGYNYRMSNLLAGLGRAQLTRLESLIAARRRHRLRYRQIFADLPGVTVLGEASEEREDDGATRENFWLTSILVNPEVAGWSAADLMHHLGERDIESRPLWKPMHRQPVFATAPSYVTGHSDRLHDRGLALPSGSALTPDQVGRIDEAIAEFVQARS